MDECSKSQEVEKKGYYRRFQLPTSHANSIKIFVYILQCIARRFISICISNINQSYCRPVPILLSLRDQVIREGRDDDRPIKGSEVVVVVTTRLADDLQIVQPRHNIRFILGDGDVVNGLLLPTSPDFTRLLPTSPDFSRLLPTSPDFSRLLPTSPDFSRLLPTSV